MDEIVNILINIQTVENKFRKIQENLAMYGAENGFTEQELNILENLINWIGETNIALDAIIKRSSTIYFRMEVKINYRRIL